MMKKQTHAPIQSVHQWALLNHLTRIAIVLRWTSAIASIWMNAFVFALKIVPVIGQNVCVTINWLVLIKVSYSFSILWALIIISKYSQLDQFQCVRCPDDSTADSVYPDCDCGGEYNENTNVCMKCIEGTTGIYPNCTCNDENAVFIMDGPYLSECQTCPPNSSGKVPNCVCDNGASAYIQNTYHFISITFIISHFNFLTAI